MISYGLSVRTNTFYNIAYEVPLPNPASTYLSPRNDSTDITPTILNTVRTKDRMVPSPNQYIAQLVTTKPKNILLPEFTQPNISLPLPIAIT